MFGWGFSLNQWDSLWVRSQFSWWMSLESSCPTFRSRSCCCESSGTGNICPAAACWIKENPLVANVVTAATFASTKFTYEKFFFNCPRTPLCMSSFCLEKVFIWKYFFFSPLRWYRGCLEFVKPIDPPGNVLTFSMYGGFLKQLSKIPSQIRRFLFCQLRASSNRNSSNIIKSPLLNPLPSPPNPLHKPSPKG